MYFIVNASPSKPFDVQVVTPDFFDVATAWSHDVEGTRHHLV